MIAAGSGQNGRVREISWRQVWEADLTADDHEQLRLLLTQLFGREGAGEWGHSWAAGRPDLRLVGYDGDDAVAHIAVAPRFVLVGGRPLLVGDTGLVGVRPSHRGTGLGLDLLARHAALVRGLELPFAFLTCTDRTTSFYVRGGWRLLPRSVRVTQLPPRGIVARACEDAAMVLPGTSGVDAWPDGDITRNGYEI